MPLQVFINFSRGKIQIKRYLAQKIISNKKITYFLNTAFCNKKGRTNNMMPQGQITFEN